MTANPAFQSRFKVIVLNKSFNGISFIFLVAFSRLPLGNTIAQKLSFISVRPAHFLPKQELGKEGRGVPSIETIELLATKYHVGFSLSLVPKLLLGKEVNGISFILKIQLILSNFFCNQIPRRIKESVKKSQFIIY